jgi:FkbM family methyltransferase
MRNDGAHRTQGGITPLDAVVAFATRRRLRGTARLRRLLRGHHEIGLTRVQTTDGLLFDLDVENFMDSAVLDHGYYEREVLDAVLAALPDAGVFWDVGANIGLHAVTVKSVRPRATVVAFEPAPYTAARLIANARLNATDLQIVTCALSDTTGLATLSIVTRGNSGLSSLRPWADVSYDARIMCPRDRAEALVLNDACPAPNVVKLDVEGYEAEVLRGFGDLLSAPTLNAIVFEAPGDFSASPERHPVSKMLEHAGFRVKPLSPAHSAEKTVATNFLAFRY